MRVIINDREEFLYYSKKHYCENCAHYKDCPNFYLCPPLDERWQQEEEFRKRYTDEKE